jgi:hypothetical protein
MQIADFYKRLLCHVAWLRTFLAAALSNGTQQDVRAFFEYEEAAFRSYIWESLLGIVGESGIRMAD